MKVYAIQTRPIDKWFPVVSWLIMIFQGMVPWNKQSYSHNAIAFSTGPDHSMVIDSNGKEGVTVSHGKNFFKKNKLIKMKELPPPMTSHLFNIWVKRVIGRKYDTLQIAGLMAKALGFISFNKYGSNYKRLTCNELVLNYLEKFNGMDFGDSDAYDLNMTWDVVVSLI